MTDKKATHQVVSTTSQSFYTSPSGSRKLLWFTGTKEECERHLPTIKFLFKNTSDEFQIIES